MLISVVFCWDPLGNSFFFLFWTKRILNNLSLSNFLFYLFSLVWWPWCLGQLLRIFTNSTGYHPPSIPSNSVCPPRLELMERNQLVSLSPLGFEPETSSASFLTSFYFKIKELLLDLVEISCYMAVNFISVSFASVVCQIWCLISSTLLQSVNSGK